MIISFEIAVNAACNSVWKLTQSRAKINQDKKHLKIASLCYHCHNSQIARFTQFHILCMHPSLYIHLILCILLPRVHTPTFVHSTDPCTNWPVYEHHLSSLLAEFSQTTNPLSLSDMHTRIKPHLRAIDKTVPRATK